LYDLTGWRLVFNTTGAIVAEAFVAMPFLIVTAEAAFRSMDRSAEEAAATLAAGAALTWARALGEFGATITFAGNTAGKTQTAPLLVYLDIESGHDAT